MPHFSRQRCPLGSEGTPSPFLSGEDEDRGSLEDQGSDDESDATGQARNLWGRAKALPGAEVGDDKEVSHGVAILASRAMYFAVGGTTSGRTEACRAKNRRAERAVHLLVRW